MARHAHASKVEVSIQKIAAGVSLEIHDNGKSFEVESVVKARGQKRLGLLGMRERVEMVGGRFGVKSTPGKGTTITAVIANGKASKNGSVEAK